MPIFFLVVGVLLVVVGINNKLTGADGLTGLLREDFTPSGNIASFQVWALAIVMVGALGYVQALKPLANALLVLVVIALLLSNKGFATKFAAALEGK